MEPKIKLSTFLDSHGMRHRLGGLFRCLTEQQKALGPGQPRIPRQKHPKRELNSFSSRELTRWRISLILVDTL